LKSWYNILFFLLISSFDCFSQEKELEVEEMNVNFELLQRYSVDSLHTYLSRSQIDALSPDDLGELLKKIPGANVKSFGGLGGLKTVSIRGLGSQHTNFVMDGFSLMNTQTGAVNLSQIQLDNVESIIVQRGESSELMLPVSAQLFSNAIVVQTTQSTPPKKLVQLRLNSKIGSFGQMDHHLLAIVGTDKLYGGAFIKYRKADGDYNYKIKNHTSEISGTRKNNDFSDLHAGANIHITLAKRHSINAHFQIMEVDQGLPGAVVLYNDFAKQRLFTTNNQFKIDYTGGIKNLNYRFYWSRSRDSIHYFDPTYLNSAGELSSSYVNVSQNFGATLSQKLAKNSTLNFGTEEVYSDLHSLESLEAKPTRWHNLSFVKATYSWNKFLFIGQLGSQYVHEINNSGGAAKSFFRVNPYAEVRKEIGKKYSAYAYYRNSFRMPNFNELYYNNIGNQDLKPEDAHQLAIGNSITLFNSQKFYFGIQLGGYYHVVENMILAIPTKNLFVWSIQNIGKNQITGADVILSVSWKISNSWRTNLTANYAFQQSLDLSDKNSPSYRNQIAYVPQHIANIDWTLNYKIIGLSFSVFYSSNRYALNENILANEIDQFATFDIALFSKFNIGNNNKIRLQLTMKNVLDNQYVFVKNFVMPGRNYLISFNYALD